MTPAKPITLNKYAKYQNAKFWFQSILDRTTDPYVNPNFPTCLLYKLDDVIIFEYDRRNAVFWVDYDTIWSVFEDRFGMKYSEIQELIKLMVEEHYKLEDIIPAQYGREYTNG